MKVKGYEIKPGANLKGACLEGADLRWTDLRWTDLRWTDLEGACLEGAIVTGTILEKKEVPENNTSLSQRVKKLEEENEKLKSTLKSLKALLDT
jgi:hypothetical protein